jgi:ATPase subunit of ABC transporter with duplicated ATPase domains
MINVSSVAKSFGPQTLFEKATFQLDRGSRYGLVGANGSGKTTFLKVLMGDEPASDGMVAIPKGTRLGVLRQDRFLDDAETVLSVAMRGDPEVYAALREQEASSDVTTPEGAARISELHEIIDRLDGYTLESRASEVLLGLGIPEDYLRKPLGTLSGGFKLRVLLGQVLVGRPDALFLDEPTNHLDILSIRWLERYLTNFDGLLVVISHDQRFLNNVTTHILDVDYRTILLYPGNYTAFEQQKQETFARKEVEIARAEKIIAEKKAFIERFKAKASKARQAQSRVKQVERIEVAELPQSSRREPKFTFAQRRPSGKDVVVVEGLSKAYGNRQVLSDVSLSIRRGDRVGIIGANGLGKSTLLKALVGKLDPDAGRIEWGHETHVGYFAQDHKDLLEDPKQTVLDFLWNQCPGESTGFVRGHLGRVLFSGDEVKKKLGAVSGGEAARLIFSKLAVEQPNVMVLDEPTNHLDIEAVQSLLKALDDYEGTILLVSHDRWFVSQLADRIIELQPDGLVDFQGGYAEFAEKRGIDFLDAEDVARLAKRQRKTDDEPAPPPPVKVESSLSWEERKKLQNRKKALPARRDRLVQDIEKAEARKAALEARFFAPDFYQATPPEEIKKLEREQAEVLSSVDRLMEEWEAVEAEIVELEDV